MGQDSHGPGNYAVGGQELQSAACRERCHGGLGLDQCARSHPRCSLRNDFIHYYYGAKLVAAGQNPYAAELLPLIEAAGGEYDPRIPHAAHPPLLLRSFGLIS